MGGKARAACGVTRLAGGNRSLCLVVFGVHRASAPLVCERSLGTMHNLNDQRQFGFERLEVWRFAMIALREIKQLEFAKFGDLRQQLERAALSIAANLAEGVGKD